jgi:hypothetical protein
MPRTPRQECVMCDKNFDLVEMRTVTDGLLRVFLAVRLSVRISSNDWVCQRCWLQYFHWRRKMEGDFDGFGSQDISNSDESTEGDVDIAIIICCFWITF